MVYGLSLLYGLSSRFCAQRCGFFREAVAGVGFAVGDGDVVAGGVFDAVHHGVGRADDAVQGRAVLGVGGEAEAGGDRDGKTFAGEESRFVQLLADAA